MTKTLQRITYVEDDADIRALAQLTLEEIGGFALQLCASGSEAVANVQGFNPDVILLDHIMPGMNGIETLKALRKIPKLRQTPVIFMTANAGKEENSRYKTLGAVGVIAKPFDPMTLAETIKGLWQTAEGVN